MKPATMKKRDRIQWTFKMHKTILTRISAKIGHNFYNGDRSKFSMISTVIAVPGTVQNNSWEKVKALNSLGC